MRAGYRIGALFAVFAVGASGFYASRLTARSAQDATADRPSQGQAILPRIALSKDAIDAVTKIDLQRPEVAGDEDSAGARAITLERANGDWELTSPIRARASASKVAALLENLGALAVTGVIEADAASYDSLGLTGDKALHVVAWAGPRKITELTFGKSTRRGQTARIAEMTGVFAVDNTPRSRGGYQGFLYTRDLRGWRETRVLQFDEDDAVRLTIRNASGVLAFARDGASWIGTVAARRPDGTLAGERPIQRLDPGKIGQMLAVYYALAADDFGDSEDRAASGVDDAERTGGVVRITLRSSERAAVVRVGSVSHAATRWTVAGSRWAVGESGDGPLIALSPWTAEWAVADASKFQSR